MSKVVEIYTDGACRGNPGPGGWGALMRYKDHEKKISGAETHTTNNRMELTAAIEALKQIKQPCEIILTTDSMYVKNGITQWLAQWKRNQWRTSNKKPIANLDLWQELDKISQPLVIDWRWVRGHSGHPENELADELANLAIDELLEKK